MARSVRQVARQRVMEAQRQRRRERAEAEKRYQALGVAVAVALVERDAAVERAELEAGQGLAKLTAEGMTIAEAVAWCGVEMSASEARRLVRLARREVTS